MKLQNLTLALIASSIIMSCGDRDEVTTQAEQSLPMYTELTTQIPIEGNWMSAGSDINLQIKSKQGNTPATIRYWYIDGFKYSGIYKRTTNHPENTIYYKQGDNYYPIKWMGDLNNLTINITWAYGGFSQKPVFQY